MFTQSPAAADSAKAVVETFATWKYSGTENIMVGNGLIVTVVGICVVFMALAIMSGTIYYIATLSQRFLSKKTSTAPSSMSNTPTPKHGVSGEVIAAIAFALDRHVNQYHDEEDTVLTIKRISRPYSPWSSKLHSITRPPFRIQSHA